MRAPVRVKMCGMTRETDILQAANLGVDAIGLIFYPKSKRYVSLEQAKTLLKNPPLFVSVVAVLVNPEADYVNELIQQLPIHYLQFHGEESPEFCRQFHKPWIKAIPANSGQAIEDAISRYHDAAAILLDTPCGDERGGSGKAFDWRIIPAQTKIPLILAGGLTPDNLCQNLETLRSALGDTFEHQCEVGDLKPHRTRTCRPERSEGSPSVSTMSHASVYAVDVCSGIEQSPGIKDHNKMTQFIKTLRGNDHD